jgi:hypothetical protein
MYGVVTRNEEELAAPEFDTAFYEVKDVTGRRDDPVASGISMISCFGDNRAAEEDPSLVPVSEDGERATRERQYFDWDYICPSREEYRQRLFETISEATAVNPDLRLDDVGFPRPEYCHCAVCEERFEASDADEWSEWRAGVITDFVAAAADRVPGRTYMTLYPDPYPGHLHERAGIDIEAIEPHVDEFVVPLYDLSYATTYWLETIASGFESRLETPFSVELYAINIDSDSLVHAAEVAESYGESVLFAYDADAARDAIAELRGETPG